MKYSSKPILFIALLVILLLANTAIYAQAPSDCGIPPPPPPNSGTTHGSPGDKNPGSAPVGSGTLLMLVFALSYAGSKVYLQRKKDEEE